VLHCVLAWGTMIIIIIIIIIIKCIYKAHFRGCHKCANDV